MLFDFVRATFASPRTACTDLSRRLRDGVSSLFLELQTQGSGVGIAGMRERVRNLTVLWIFTRIRKVRRFRSPFRRRPSRGRALLELLDKTSNLLLGSLRLKSISSLRTNW
jgi:hypothetical protein